MRAAGAAPTEDTLAPLYRVHAAVSVVLLAVTLAINLSRLPRVASPPGVIAASVVMVGATVASVWAYASRRRRRTWVMVADIGLTLVLTAVSGPLLGPARPGEMALPITGCWLAAAPLAVAIARGWWAGAGSAALVGAAAFGSQPDPGPQRWGPLLVLVAAAAGLGAMVDQMRATTRERQQVYATAAAMAERQRLARIVHDGVLQVLAMVEREGAHLGPRGAMLARLSRDQEVQLRALLQDTDLSAESRDPRDHTHRNFAVVLDGHASSTVTVSAPAEPLLLASGRAAELDAAITEVLTNVAKHAGPGARAWLLLEREDNDLIVSIRDNGVGGDPKQFAEAMQSGRMGMKHSIYGRIHDLGGTANLRTAPGRGVEWEFRIPVEL